MYDTCYPRFIQTHRVSKCEPNVSYGLWLIICPCRFIDCYKGIVQVQILIMGNHVSVGTEGTLELLVTSAQFCCELNWFKKIKPFQKFKKINADGASLYFAFPLFISLFHVIMNLEIVILKILQAEHTYTYIHRKEENVINRTYPSPRLSNYPHVVTLASSLSSFFLCWKHFKANPTLWHSAISPLNISAWVSKINNFSHDHYTFITIEDINIQLGTYSNFPQRPRSSQIGLFASGSNKVHTLIGLCVS